jgi:hypothetical protein
MDATKGLELCAHVREGQRIRMGEPLLAYSSTDASGRV